MFRTQTPAEGRAAGQSVSLAAPLSCVELCRCVALTVPAWLSHAGFQDLLKRFFFCVFLLNCNNIFAFFHSKAFVCKLLARTFSSINFQFLPVEFLKLEIVVTFMFSLGNCF